MAVKIKATAELKLNDSLEVRPKSFIYTPKWDD